MTEIVFMVQDHPERGYCARSLGAPLFVVGEDFAQLRRNARAMVQLYFAVAPIYPEIIRFSYYPST
jgi:hypothetical protein